jgi:hypothetical protein
VPRLAWRGSPGQVNGVVPQALPDGQYGGKRRAETAVEKGPKVILPV